MSKFLTVLLLSQLSFNGVLYGKGPEPSGGKKEEGDFVIEKRKDGSTVKYKKKNVYDFEGAEVQGLYKRPSGSFISTMKDVKGRSIIRMRENFDHEVVDSVRMLK